MLKLVNDSFIPVVSLKEYLTQHQTINIPAWQREYSWKTTDEGQVQVLVRDLAKFSADGEASDYLMGSIILCEDKQEDGQNKLLLIDGQQRSLTLTLFLMACNKYIKTFNLIDAQDSNHILLAGDILECLNKERHGSFEGRINMNQSGANEILAKLYTWCNDATDFSDIIFKNTEKATLTQKNLLGAAETIYDSLKEEQYFKKDDLLSSLFKILRNVKFIELTLTDKKESIAVFDRINDRGLILSNADLIKNIIFGEVDDKDFDTIADYWNNMSEKLMFTKKSRLQDPKFLLRALAHIEDGAHPGYDSLADHWRDRFHDSTDSKTARIFAQELPLKAEQLLNFVEGVHPEHGVVQEIYLPNELGSVQHFSVLLAGAQIRDSQAFFTLMNQVSYRTLLYMFAKERTQAFDLMVPEWAHAVWNLGEKATKTELVRVYRDHALPSEQLFSDLKERMLAWNYESASDRKKMRAVLALLSADLNNQCAKPIKIQDAMRSRKIKNESHPWELEHIAPKSKNKSPIFHSIGNLVLLAPSDNRDASDADPSNKGLHYNQCQLVLTKSLSKLEIVENEDSKIMALNKKLGHEDISWNLDSWNEKSINQRSLYYYDYLVSLFKSISDI